MAKLMCAYKNTFGFHQEERVLFFETGRSQVLPPVVVDVAVVEVDEASDGLAKQIAARAKMVIGVPVPTMSCLWPFAYVRAPEKLVDRMSSIGHLGDAQIDKLITDDVGPAKAVHCYCAAIADLHLDTALAEDLARFRDLDRKTGFEIEPVIASLFQSEQIFLAPDAPNGRLLAVVARQLYIRMGLQGGALELAILASAELADRVELPIHPVVARAYGLSYLDERSSFCWRGGADVTFDDYIRLSVDPEDRADIRIQPHFTKADSRHALLQEAQAAQARGDPAEAESGYIAFIAAQPEDPDGWIILARFLMHAGRMAQAWEAVEAAAVLASDYAPTLELIAEISIESGKASAAVAAASRLAEVAPGRRGINRLLALALRMNGKFLAAEMPARRALAEEPDEPHHYHLLAGIFDDEGKRIEAITLLQKALARGLEDAHTRNALAELYEAAGRRADAVALLEEGLGRGKANDQTYSLLGHFRLREGAYAMAVTAFAKGAELYPEREDIRENLREAEVLATN